MSAWDEHIGDKRWDGGAKIKFADTCNTEYGGVIQDEYIESFVLSCLDFGDWQSCPSQVNASCVVLIIGELPSYRI